MPMTLSGTTGIALPTAAAPAFSAYQSTQQTISGSTYTKVNLQTEEFDTNSNFDNATNYRFTPTVAGYYQVNASSTYVNACNGLISVIYKNGSAFKAGAQSSGTYTYGNTVSALIYMNGSSDYIEFYTYQSSGSQAMYGTGQPYIYFQASMVRSA